MTDRIHIGHSGPSTDFWLEADEIGTNVATNQSTVRFYLRCANGGAGSTSSRDSNTGWQNAEIDGIGQIAIHGPTAPFLPSGYAAGQLRWRDGPYDVNVGHNADGTGGITIRMKLYYGDNVSTYLPLSTIPRASTPSFSGSSTFDPGTTQTINTNRASSSFTHDILYSFGSSGWVTIATGVATSTTWTPPMSLLDSIPNSPSGVGTLRCNTYNGGSLIGTKDINFTITTPASVIPTWTSVSSSEAVSAVSSTVGAYVQNVSKLNYAITGAAGVYSSTIALQRFTCSGQTVDGASGTTPNVISASGTVPVTWLIQDSRGKQKTQTSNITVLPYTNPLINSVTIQRCLSDGTLAPDDGTYLKVTINAQSQSLINGTEKNIIQLKIRSRLLGATTAWTDPTTLKTTLNPSGITYNSNTVVAGPYDVDKSYEVRVEALDRFNLSASQQTVAVGAIFMHWTATGMGLGKYLEKGALDVQGDIFQSGALVMDANDMYNRVAVLDKDYRGQGPATVKLLSNGTTITSVPWAGRYVPNGPRVVILARTETGYYIVGQSWRTDHGAWADLTFQNGWQNYNVNVNDNSWNTAGYTKTHTGIVVLKGLIRGGTATGGTTIATLPVGYRPDTETLFLASTNDTPTYIRVRTDGQVQVGVNTTNQYITLEHVRFPAAGVATWTDVGSGGSSFANSWVGYQTVQYGTPGFWKDPYGHVWFRGMVSSGSNTVDNTTIINMPATHRVDLEQHLPTSSNGGYGLVGGQPTNGLNWKNGGANSNVWITLGGVVWRTSDSLTANTWVTPAMSNSWVAYSGTFTAPSYTRREDGLCFLAGLMRTGTIGTKAFQIASPEFYGVRSGLRMSVAALGNARLDIQGVYANNAPSNAGVVLPAAGSNTWFTLDGQTWIPEPVV